MCAPPNKDKSEPAKKRDLRMQLVCEQLTNAPQEDQFVSADMRRGTDLEPAARLAFEAATGELLDTTGFLSHNAMLVGASLDGHMGDFETIIELKAPRPATHLRYIRAGGLPAEHRWQVLHNLFVSGASAAEFVSYCPAFPEPLQLFRARLERDEKEIHQYRMLLSGFLEEVAKEVEAVRALMVKAA
jgi:hypothetical protein